MRHQSHAQSIVMLFGQKLIGERDRSADGVEPEREDKLQFDVFREPVKTSRHEPFGKAASRGRRMRKGDDFVDDQLADIECKDRLKRHDQPQAERCAGQPSTRFPNLAKEPNEISHGYMGLVKAEWIEAQERGWSALDTHVCAACVEDSYLKGAAREEACGNACEQHLVYAVEEY